MERMMAKKLLRPKEIQKRLGIGPTRFWDDYVRNGKLKLKRLGPRSVAALEEDVDRLIDELPDRVVAQV
jgi:predicted DNA-binding transcriptional regulator AlpA